MTTTTILNAETSLHITATSVTIPRMDRRTLLQSLPVAALLPTVTGADAAEPATTVYELRVYHTFEGKLDDLLRRFREHTMQLFEKHGIKNVAYWTPTEEPLKGKPSATNPKPTAKSSKRLTPLSSH